MLLFWWSDKNTFLTQLLIIFHIIFCCPAKLLERVVHNHCLIPLLPFLWNPLQLLHPHCTPETILAKVKSNFCDQIQRSAEAFYLAHQLGLTLLTALSSTLHLASRILSFLGFPPTSPAAPCLFTWFVLFSQFFLAVGVPLGLVVGPLHCFYSPHSWRSHPVSWPEKYHLKG